MGAFGLPGNRRAGRGLGMFADGDQSNAKGDNYLPRVTFQATDKLTPELCGGISQNRDDLVEDRDFRSNSKVTAVPAAR